MGVFLWEIKNTVFPKTWNLTVQLKNRGLTQGKMYLSLTLGFFG